MKYVLFSAFFLLMILAPSCKREAETNESSSDPSSTSATEQPGETKTAKDQLEDKEYVFGEDGVFGLSAGQAITEAGSKLEKGVLRTGEGEFDVYFIKDTDGEEIGYVLPGYPDESKIGDIFLTSPKFRDEIGIRVGKYFRQLQHVYPGIQAHGSEIEARVYAVQEPFKFRLDYMNTQYDLDEDEIPATTKITEIILTAPRPSGE